MKINIKTQDQLCYNAANGYILIDSIDLEGYEKEIYRNYTIEWSSNIDKSQIHHSKLFVQNLCADEYSFRICGPKTCGEWQKVRINQVKPLNITNVIVNNNPCEQTASISLDISGGTKPYRIKYGNIYRTTDKDTISLTNITHPINDTIKVVDANDCMCESHEPIITNFSRLICSIDKILAPQIYDDHPQECSLRITNNHTPIKFIIYDISDPNDLRKIHETNWQYNASNIYDISSFIYPGQYMVSIQDTHGCSYTLQNIVIPNTNPLSALVSVKNHVDSTVRSLSDTIYIYDTLLIPYNLIKSNYSIYKWINTLTLNSKLVLEIGAKTYQQKIITFYKQPQQDNFIDILHLGESNDQWFFSINIARGLDPKIDDIYSKNIYLKILDDQFLVVPELDNDLNSIKLVRGTLLINTTNKTSFENTNSIKIYEKLEDNFIFLDEIRYTHYQHLNNIYQPTNILCVNFLENPLLHSYIDIFNSHTHRLTSETMSIIDSIQQTMCYINDTNKKIYIESTNHAPNNGAINVSVHGNLSAKNYKLEYKTYNTIDNIICDIFIDNQTVHTPYLCQLPPGIYIIKVHDPDRNKIRFINHKNYDNHFVSSKTYIENKLNKSLADLDFNYGDILICLNENDENIPGISERIEAQSLHKISTMGVLNPTQDIIVCDSEENNNCLTILNPLKIKYNIKGPNLNHNIQVDTVKITHMPEGVYTIVSDEADCYTNLVTNENRTIYISKNSIEFIVLAFRSYKNIPVLR